MCCLWPQSLPAISHLTAKLTPTTSNFTHVLLLWTSCSCYTLPLDLYAAELRHLYNFVFVFLLQFLPPVCLPFTSPLSTFLLFSLLTFCFAFVHFHSYSCHCTSTCYSSVTYIYIEHYQQWDLHPFLFGPSARDIAEPSLLPCNGLTLDPQPVLSSYAMLVCPLPAVAPTRPDTINLNNWICSIYFILLV